MYGTNMKSTLDIMCDALINQSCLFLILALTPSIKNHLHCTCMSACSGTAADNNDQ